jgi:hypothetical protein
MLLYFLHQMINNLYITSASLSLPHNVESVINIIVTNPAFIASVILRIDVDALYPPLVCGSKDLRTFKISPRIILFTFTISTPVILFHKYA